MRLFFGLDRRASIKDVFKALYSEFSKISAREWSIAELRLDEEDYRWLCGYFF